jgi:magnesium chelatase family protein
MLVKTFGSAVHGISATTVTVEVNISQGVNFSWWACPTALSKKATNGSMPP